MTCNVIDGPHGRFFLCGDRADRILCGCGAESTKLCDFAIDNGTCDAPICNACATTIGSPVLRMSLDSAIRTLASPERRARFGPNAHLDIAGRPVSAFDEDTVDHCPKHAVMR